MPQFVGRIHPKWMKRILSLLINHPPHNNHLNCSNAKLPYEIPTLKGRYFVRQFSVNGILKEMAGNLMAFRNLTERRGLLTADFLCVGAPGVEPAAGGDVHGAGQTALDNLPVGIPRLLRVRNRIRGKQGLRVRVKRMVVDFAAVAAFHQTAEVHHADMLRDMPHHGKIMRNKQIGDA